MQFILPGIVDAMLPMVKGMIKTNVERMCNAAWHLFEIKDDLNRPLNNKPFYNLDFSLNKLR